MNKAFKKIVERLEEKKSIIPVNRLLDDIIKDKPKELGQLMAYNNSIKIVQEVAEEYKGGWIKCSDSMPKEHDSMFAKYKGTDKWDDCMFEKTSDVVNVTVIDEYGKGATTHAHTIDGKWACDLLKVNKLYKIIAWQPLPEPYRESEQNDGNV